MKGWKTVLFGLLMVIAPPALAFIGGYDWSSLGLPPWAVMAIGVVVIGLRSITTTPIGKPTVSIAALAFALAMPLAACQQVASAEGTVCAEIAKAQADSKVAGPLDALDPHSAAGVLWADTKSACANGAPAAGVTTDWAGLVWGELKALAPTVLPLLIGLL